MLFAALSALMNNLPTVMVGCLTIADTQLNPLTRELMIYANLIGSNLGPKITPLGSLATLLWLHVLGQRGIHVGSLQYIRIGIVLTLPVLVATLLSLTGWELLLH